MDSDDEDTDHEVFVTVRIRTPSSDGYRYPGFFPVLNEVMAEQKRERLQSQNVDSAGDETGYVADEPARVTGASGGLLGMYTKQQREHFPDVPGDGATAWRARPVSLPTATALATADSVFESFFARLGESRRLYGLPYLRGPPAELDPGGLVSRRQRACRVRTGPDGPAVGSRRRRRSGDRRGSRETAPRGRDRLADDTTTPLGPHPLVCVSTQVIEAGVDVSFDRVFRDLAPIPSLVQTAGRCNRSLEGATGRVTVWRLDGRDGRVPSATVYGTEGSGAGDGATREAVRGLDPLYATVYDDVGSSEGVPPGLDDHGVTDLPFDVVDARDGEQYRIVDGRGLR